MLEPEPTPATAPVASFKQERRAFVRLDSDLAATCRPPHRGKEVSWAGQVQNISQGGLGLLMRHRFRPGTHLAVELRQSSGALLRTVKVVVIHARAVSEEGNPCWLLGCTFDETLSEEELEALL